MKDKAKAGNLFLRLRYHSLWLLLLWTGCIAASLLWNLYEQREKILKIARNSAEITFENDILYRRWAAKQGGVYVPASKDTPPNPYLNVPERDVTTSSGLSLTLVNPAYMARQVNQMADRHGSQGHITSLNPIRPENKPDSWETSALKSFQKGIQEVSSVEKMDGQEYMRLMRPFIAEKACLKCHASQGYKEGDIRGGISVSVPMAPLWAIEKPLIMKISLAHLILWMVGMGGIVISKRGLGKEILARQKAEAVLSEARNELEQRVQERTAELAEANQALRNLSSKILSTQEEERKRIGGEIHDALGGCLSGIKFKVEDVLRHMEEDPNAMAQSLGTIIPVIQEGMEECRRIQTDLRPPMLDDLGLLSTLSWFCRRFQTIYSGIRVEPEIDVEENEIPGPLKIVIYRIAQESMNNIAKHSKADTIRLSLGKRPGRIEFVLQDNGRGFEPEKVSLQEKRGLGLMSMKERTELSGGSFAIESEEGKGTLVRASWPFQGDGQSNQ